VTLRGLCRIFFNTTFQLGQVAAKLSERSPGSDLNLHQACCCSVLLLAADACCCCSVLLLAADACCCCSVLLLLLAADAAA
jgi:hypothetical protein